MATANMISSGVMPSRNATIGCMNGGYGTSVPPMGFWRTTLSITIFAIHGVKSWKNKVPV